MNIGKLIVDPKLPHVPTAQTDSGRRPAQVDIAGQILI